MYVLRNGRHRIHGLGWGTPFSNRSSTAISPSRRHLQPILKDWENRLSFSSESKSGTKPQQQQSVQAGESSADGIVEAPPLSKRKQFKQIQVHPSILRYIDTIGVGYTSNAKRRKRRPYELDKDGRSSSTTLPPAPFTVQGKRVQLIGSVSTVEDLFPTNRHGIPEVAMCGRSNVGKSTLLNALLYGNQPNTNSPENVVRHKHKGKVPTSYKLPKGVKAVTSDRPGETRSVDFYHLGSNMGAAKGKHLRLVDLPGYGYAYTQTSNEFFPVIANYLLERGSDRLKRILFLIDARHGMKKADKEFLRALEQEAVDRKMNMKRAIPPIQIVLTKCDLVPRIDIARRVVLVKQQLLECLRREPSSLPVMLVSARAGVGFNNVKGSRARGGILELQKELAALVPGFQNTEPDGSNKSVKESQQSPG